MEVNLKVVCNVESIDGYQFQNWGLGISIPLIDKKQILMKETFEKMKNFVKSYYIKPEKIVENKSQIEEDIDLEVKSCCKSNITGDEFQPK